MSCMKSARQWKFRLQSSVLWNSRICFVFLRQISKKWIVTWRVFDHNALDAWIKDLQREAKTWVPGSCPVSASPCSPLFSADADLSRSRGPVWSLKRRRRMWAGSVGLSSGCCCCSSFSTSRSCRSCEPRDSVLFRSPRFSLSLAPARVQAVKAFKRLDSLPVGPFLAPSCSFWFSDSRTRPFATAPPPHRTDLLQKKCQQSIKT